MERRKCVRKRVRDKKKGRNGKIMNGEERNAKVYNVEEEKVAATE